MTLINCSDCGEGVSKKAESCPHCGKSVTWADTKNGKNGFKGVISEITNKDKISISSGLNKTLTWFVLVNAAVVISITILTAGEGVVIIPFLLLLGAIFPFGALLASKWLAKRAHNIRLIEEGTDIESERQLFDLVNSLRNRAGLEVMPEVGVYTSEEMNAFATGPSKKNSLVAFSDSLLKKMEEDEIAAIAAHEISHIANGDMITLSIVQSVINALVILITIPLFAWQMNAIASNRSSWFSVMAITVVKFIIVTILLFLGNLVVKAFSRKREFEADKLASELLNKQSMIKALKSLGGDISSIRYDKAVESYASMKINSPPSKLNDIFSTHPSIERRIAALS
jgi:heat shock protein HtpX